MGQVVVLAEVQDARVEVQLEFELGLPPRMARVPGHRGNGVSAAAVSVGQFHVAFGLPIARTPKTDVPKALANLRLDLVEEEVRELRDAVEREDLVAIADALGDILYVTYGSALTWGIDLDRVVREVHRANMSKLGPDGRPVLRSDGKVLKPPTYSPPDIRGTLLDQPPLFID